jgi:hypothetical protein
MHSQKCAQCLPSEQDIQARISDLLVRTLVPQHFAKSAHPCVKLASIPEEDARAGIHAKRERAR